RIWARTMKERFGARNPRSWMCRFHTQTAGVSLTAQQPYNNVVRTALQPLAGSYFVETLTNDIEAEALEYFRKIDALGGMVAAIERGFPQREIQEAAFQFQKAVESKDKIIVGVNEYVMDEKPFSILYIDESVAESQTASV